MAPGSPEAGETESLLERDRRLEASGVPMCPCCGERDKVMVIVGVWWCERCIGFLPALSPRPRRYTPDF